jgi:peptide chain release factor 2
LLVFSDFYKDGEANEAELGNQFNLTLQLIEDLESRNMLRNEEDKLGAILKINAGAGGTESQDWALMLMRMYTRYAERHNYKIKEIDYLKGEEAGIKTVTLEFDGEYAYGFLKCEMAFTGWFVFHLLILTQSVILHLHRFLYYRLLTTLLKLM